MLTTKKPDAMGANESGCSLHEPTQPRPLPGGEQAFLRALSVPLLGGVRGGFMVPMRDGMAVAAFHEPGHWSAAVCAAPAAARREHPERCGWVFDHSRAPRDPPRFMVPMHAKKKRKEALHEPGSAGIPAGVLPVGVSPARMPALPKSASRFMGPMRGGNVLGFSTAALTIV